MDEIKHRPAWLPDTQGFLAMAIIIIVALIVLLLLLRPIAIDERTAGVLMVVIGVLTACLKDVYSFFFGSSKGSEKKDDMIANSLPAPPATPVATTTTVTDDKTVTRTAPAI